MNQLAEHIRRLNGDEKHNILIAEVESIEDRIALLKPLDGSARIKARLAADIKTDKGLLVKPVIGSVVMAGRLNDTDWAVVMYSEIDSVELMIEEKIHLSNPKQSLIDLIDSLIKEINAAIITTPAGAGNVSPTTQGKLNKVLTDFKMLLK